MPKEIRHPKKMHIMGIAQTCPLFLVVYFCMFHYASTTSIPGTGDAVQLHIEDNQVIMDNGLVQVNFSRPDGFITGVQYNRSGNLLEVNNTEDNQGYWDLHYGTQLRISGNSFNVISQNEDQVEISFSRTWNSSNDKNLPLNIDIRYIMQRGVSGFYTYGIFEREKGWPSLTLTRTRISFKLSKDKFKYLAISKTRQRRMPLPEDREPPRGKPLQFKEAVLLVDPVESEFKGQVDDKYMYSSNNEDIKVHGWVSTNPRVGFWQITPSYEDRAGGPFKQDLTSHVGPTSLTIFYSSHYMGQDLIPKFQNGEAWKKVLGPVLIYLNSGEPNTTESQLWDDADKQLQLQSERWPYSFLSSNDYPKPDIRGSVHGRLLVRDRVLNKLDPANASYIGLALPGEVGSWQTECKGYQFWNTSGFGGEFTIKNIHAGEYNLYGWVPGYIGDYKYETLITIKEGETIDLGDIIFEPPRNGTTLWEIGVPDRTASEFFIPDVDPGYVNPLYLNQDKFRQYGLWEQYSVLYPNQDLIYNVNSSDYTKDWFFAHVTRKVGNSSYRATTWQIKFHLDSVDQSGPYYLRLALASTTGAQLQVRVNDLNATNPHFTSGKMYKDNAIARHGIHGLYVLLNVDVKVEWLRQGENIIHLTQARGRGPFQGVMYDYIRLEAPFKA